MLIFKLKTVWFVVLVLSFYTLVVQAATFGEVAQNLYEPVSLIIELLRAVSILCGGGLILGGFFRFIEYRRNPIAIRLSMVVFMFVFGIGLILLGLTPTSALDWK
jgi:hypothetical protein